MKAKEVPVLTGWVSLPVAAKRLRVKRQRLFQMGVEEDKLDSLRQVPGGAERPAAYVISEAELCRLLFERTRVDPRLSEARARLYREASRYAEKFCRRLERTLARAQGGCARDAGETQVLAELRRFYRFTHARKRAHIERGR